jgi:hypothetical protein
MSFLANEILLRLAKALAALVVAVVLWIVLVPVIGVAASPELALLCWLSGAAFILLVESSPI